MSIFNYENTTPHALFTTIKARPAWPAPPPCASHPLLVDPNCLRARATTNQWREDRGKGRRRKELQRQMAHRVGKKGQRQTARVKRQR